MVRQFARLWASYCPIVGLQVTDDTVANVGKQFNVHPYGEAPSAKHTKHKTLAWERYTQYNKSLFFTSSIKKHLHFGIK